MAKKKKNQPEAAPAFPERTAKEERLFQNLLKTVLQYMQGRGFASMSEGEFRDKLGFPPQHTEVLKEVLATLVTQGYAEVLNGRYRLKKSGEGVITGILRMHPRGFGFLQADDSVRYPQDVFIPKHLTQNAVDGDKVEVQVNTEVISEKGPEGKVTAIITRGRTHLAGIIREIESYGDVIAHVPILGATRRVIVQPSEEFSLKEGDRIVMKVVEWGGQNEETICKASHFLGHISDPSCDVKAAVEEYDLRDTFPHHVVEEAHKCGTRVSTKDIASREDLREMEVFTIDPDTAKDFDDAVNLTKDRKGHYHLGVHIADVSHYVKSGTAMDDEAKLRCNSTYFPGRCIPMLPSELSDNLCSLKANVNRLTISILMEFDSEGNMVNYRIARSVIKSAKRFSYREAKEVLDGKKKSQHLPTLNLMVELCKLLKKKRYERGSLEFAIPELVIRVDENGVPTKMELVEYDITHQLIEEFMLKSNEVVATHLTEKGKNLTYRVHDVPAEENMKDFAILAGAFGFKLSSKPTPVELQKLFDEAVNTPYAQYLATSYIRRMRLAIYSAENIGHYGLSLTHYCHFTSPIRRYVDLVVHRILFGESDEREDLEMIAARSSEQERISAKAESSVVLLKKLRLIEMVNKQEEHRQYEAIVTRVKNFGIYFEVLDYMLEGFLHVADLEGDYYVFDEKRMRLRGNRTGRTYESGDKITVMLRSLDFILLESDWTLVGEAKHRRSSEEGERKNFGERKRFGKKKFGEKSKEKKSNRGHTFGKKAKSPQVKAAKPAPRRKGPPSKRKKSK
jgi:ribonuclease R